MKKVTLAFAIIISLPVTAAFAETLNNESIISLVRSGIGEETILAKIKGTEGEYETSVTDLIHLKKANVPSRVITAMVENSGKKANVASPAWSVDARDPMIPHPPGVYILTDRSDTAKMVTISPTISRQTKSGVFWSYALTGGIASMSYKAIVPGAHAHTKSNESKPIFYFYFEQTGQSTPSSFWMSGNISAPTEFALVKFDVKKDHREKKIGKFNIMGAKSGLKDKDRIIFTYSLIGPGIYEVIPVVDLPAGEYGFVLDSPSGANGGISGNSGATGRIFDFSVRAKTTLQ